MNPETLKTEALRLRQLADLEERQARSILERVKATRSASKALDHAAGIIGALDAPAVHTTSLGD